MIPLKCIVEYAILQGQSYDIGADFGNFQRAVDGTTEQVKQRFEQSINNKLRGKRIRARASRGYKQFEKDYEFDASRITIDDYYDNFVVVAHDESGRKPKEYFLKPGAKIQIIGLASGHPSPNTTPGEPQGDLPRVVASPEQPKMPRKETSPMDEDKDKYDAYPIESIADDIKKWARILMKDTRLGERSFVKSLGWSKTLPDGRSVAVFDLEFPVDQLKTKLTEKALQTMLSIVSGIKDEKVDVRFQLVKFEPQRDAYKVRIKKITKNIGNKPERAAI